MTLGWRVAFGSFFNGLHDKDTNTEKLTGLFRRSGARLRVCLEIRPDGIAWSESGGPGAARSGFTDCLPARRQAALGELVENHSWAGAATTLVLPLDQYQVFQMDRPEGIEESELGDALKWKLKDFLDFSPSEAVSDVFPFPKDASRGRGELVNVVAARRVSGLGADCAGAGSWPGTGAN